MVQYSPPSQTARAVIALLKVYKALFSPFFAGSCRFHPSCSDYMREAVEHFGVLKGLRLGVGRLARCHPFGGQGYDPVDPVFKSRT